jgi:hypothetical protein
MDWQALFDRASGFETTVTEVRETLDNRRERPHDD